MAGDPTDDPFPRAAAPAGNGDVPAPDTPGTARPSERLRARAEATDRATRFEQRLAEVRRVRDRRRRIRRLVRLAWAAGLAGLGALAPIVVAAVLTAPDPSGQMLLVGAAVGAAIGTAGPSLRNWLASRRGAQAWDAYSERYVLLGDPSVEVRDADQPHGGGGPPRP